LHRALKRSNYTIYVTGNVWLKKKDYGAITSRLLSSLHAQEDCIYRACKTKFSKCNHATCTILRQYQENVRNNLVNPFDPIHTNINHVLRTRDIVTILNDFNKYDNNRATSPYLNHDELLVTCTLTTTTFHCARLLCIVSTNEIGRIPISIRGPVIFPCK
jgi:hypothetical protein